MDFYVAVQRSCVQRHDVQLIHPDDLVASFPDQSFNGRNPFALHVKIAQGGILHEIGVVPDFVFGLLFSDGSRRCFVVEIDRGTMPVARHDIRQTSLERKMRGYLTAHATKQHERRFGWKTFRVLTVTTDDHRAASALETLRRIRVAHSPGPSLFLFATRLELFQTNPLSHVWQDGNGRDARLI